MEPLHFIAINLDHRTDRWNELMKAFPNRPIERFPGLTKESGLAGCRASHLAVIQLAKDRKLPWVAILEDDCEPYDSFEPVLAKILPLLWKHRSSWDIYNGGPIGLKSMYPIELPLLRIDVCTCLQCIIVHEGAYDAILKGPIPDVSVDDYYSRFRCVTSVTPLAYQRASMSDVNPGKMGGEKRLFDIAYKYASMFERKV